MDLGRGYGGPTLRKKLDTSRITHDSILFSYALACILQPMPRGKVEEHPSSERPVAAVAFAELEKEFRRKLKHTARFYRVDLHAHTPASHDFKHEGTAESTGRVSPDEIVSAACKKELYVLAITDHNRSDGVSAIALASDKVKDGGQNLYPNNCLRILPGIEFTVEENTRTIHLLGIFPENTPYAEVEKVLDSTGVPPDPAKRGADTKITKKRLSEIVERIHQRGGIAILPHVNSTNGYRYEHKQIGKSDEQILQQIIDLKADAVEIKKPEETRHFRAGDRQIACVIGSDAHCLAEYGAKGHITRVKMGEPGFTDLKRAILDPETRLRFEDERITGIKRILGVRMEGGFLDGQVISFTANLNCLIGGRGAGKSTLIEIIRYLFEWEVPARRKKEVGDLREAVMKGSTMTLLFEDDKGENYVLQRRYGDAKTKIYTLEGIERAEVDLRFSENIKVSIYGWSEIEGIAAERSQQMELLDQFIEGVDELKNQETASLTGLETNARSIESEIQKMEDEEPRIGNLRELEAEYKALGKGESEAEIQKAKVATEAEAARKLEAAISDLEGKCDINIEEFVEPICAEVEQARADGNLLSMDIFREVVTLLRKEISAEGDIAKRQSALLNKIRDVKTKVSSKLGELKPIHEKVDEAFTKFVEALPQPDRKNLARRREQLRGQIQQRKEAKDRLKQAKKDRTRLETERETLILQLLGIRHALYEKRAAHILDIERQLPKGRAKVEIQLGIKEQGNRDKLIKLLHEKLRNLPRHWIDQKYPESIAEKLTPIEFVRAVRDGNAAGLSVGNITAEKAADVINHLKDKPKDLMEIESCECSDLPQILFDVEGEKKPIENLSPGQRCTALLPIILLESKTPLVIDQPEDNLDNQFIFDLVVATMRSLKERRQIIVATHNPNIPVSGDAENIMVFKPIGSKGRVERNGSIDHAPIIDDVKTIMEGGEEAFRLRSKKYFGEEPARL
jgi:predicted ATPase